MVGGAETYLRAVVRALKQRAHVVGLLYENRLKGSTPLLEDMAETWCLADLGVEETLAIVRRWAPSILYVHHWSASEMEQELLKRYPAIFFAHDYGRLCPTGRRCLSFPAQPCSRRAGPACLALHYPRRCGGLNPVTAWRNYQWQARGLDLLTRYSAVLGGSRYMIQQLAAHAIRPERIHLAPLFAPDAVPDAVAPEARAARGRLLLVGRLVDVKGADVLIRALPLASAKLRYGLTLSIAGSGPEEASLRALAARAGAEVHFLGWLSGGALERQMRQADLLVLPSLWPEPFGLVGLEAGCIGLPTVAFSSGGVTDWLLAGRSGELAPADPPTPTGLADAIVRALADPKHYQQLREGAWQTAKQFSLDAHIEKLESVMEKVTSDAAVCA